jgi:hypothetical protein
VAAGEQRVARAIALLEGNGLVRAGLKPSDLVDFGLAPPVS